MNRTTNDITGLVLLKLMEHYKHIHLDIHVLFVDSVTFLLAKSKDIRYVL